jgi:AcrR family transcriptional regulator
VLIYRYGLRGFTMDDVSSELGMSKKTVYKYFESKNQLISELVDRIVELEQSTFLKEIEKRSHWLEKLEVMLTVYTPDDVPYKLIDELYRYFPSEKEKIEKLMGFRQNIILPLIEQGQKNGEIASDLDPAIIFLFLRKLFMTPTDQNLLEANDITVKQLLAQMKKLFFHGILKSSGGKL